LMSDRSLRITLNPRRKILRAATRLSAVRSLYFRGVLTTPFTLLSIKKRPTVRWAFYVVSKGKIEQK
jgi:hypothetical protein